MIIMVESGVMDTGCQVLNQPWSDFQRVGDTLYLCGNRFVLTSGRELPRPLPLPGGTDSGFLLPPQPGDIYIKGPTDPHLKATPTL